MKTYFCTILFVCMFFISCREANYYVPDEIKYVNTKGTYHRLEAELLPFSVLVPNQISFIDSLLVIMTRNPTEFISIVNTKNDCLIANLGSEGRGPNEYMAPYSLKQYDTNEAGDRLLYVTDNMIQVKPFNVTRSVDENNAVCERPVRISEWAVPFFLPQGRMFMRQNVSYDDPRDMVFYPPKYILRSGQDVKECNIYPKVMRNVDFLTLPLSLYNAVTRVKPDLTKVVDVMGYLDNMNIVDPVSGKCIGVVEQEAYLFKDLVDLTMEELLGTLKCCAIDACVTNEYIIVLYDGRNVDAAENQREELKPLIKVFDWEGDFVNAYQVSEPLRGIAYDEAGKCLYGFDMEEKFYRYRLSID